MKLCYNRISFVSLSVLFKILRKEMVQVMVYEILNGMFGAAHLRRQARCQMKDFEKNLRLLKWL